jgi:hypothetical protein
MKIWCASAGMVLVFDRYTTDGAVWENLQDGSLEDVYTCKKGYLNWFVFSSRFDTEIPQCPLKTCYSGVVLLHNKCRMI